MESLSRWQKLKANKMPSLGFRTKRTESGASAVSVSLTAFMIEVSVSRETKNPAPFSGAGRKKTGFKLFSFALPACRPYRGGVQELNNKCGYGGIRKNGSRGGAGGETAGIFLHHLVAHRHSAWNVHPNNDMSNGGNV
ncbi:MAG TPA: hypothetical protein VFE51_27515 [Verrucomicrobiae bacterium]|nr:hypothetical protein [Verrucomicrobiae bacterium]